MRKMYSNTLTNDDIAMRPMDPGPKGCPVAAVMGALCNRNAARSGECRQTLILVSQRSAYYAFADLNRATRVSRGFRGVR